MPMDSHRPQFSLERLEQRLVLSNVVAITFDPEGTVVKSTGTVNGVKFIELKRGGGNKDVFGFPAGGGHQGGKALVFATDLDSDSFIDSDEITGIALAADVKATI